MPSSVRHRKRLLYGLLTVSTLLMGVASRRFFGEYPFVRLYAGDALWALMVFFGVACFFPRWPVWGVAGAALGFCFSVEFSQIYHAPWIDGLRATTLGGLILGFTFVWSDLLCYSVGVGIGAAIDGWFVSRRSG